MSEPHTHGGTDAPECTTCSSTKYVGTVDLSSPKREVVVEWRVTGKPNTLRGIEWPWYSHTWYSNQMYDDRNRKERELVLTAEQAAKNFHSKMSGLWEQGPFLHSRVVVYNSWTEWTKNE